LKIDIWCVYYIDICITTLSAPLTRLSYYCPKQLPRRILFVCLLTVELISSPSLRMCQLYRLWYSLTTMQRYHRDMLHIRSRMHDQHLSSLSSFSSSLTQSSKDDTPMDIINHQLSLLSLSSRARCTIDNVLSITVLCDIILMMLLPRELITSLPRVCNEWNRKYIYQSSTSMTRERYWRQQLSSSTISSMVKRPHPLKVVDADDTVSLMPQHGVKLASDQLLNVSKDRKGWCHRVVAHSTVHDRWRSGRCKRTCRISDNSCLLYYGTYFAGVDRTQVMVWHMNDGKDESDDSKVPLFTIELPLGPSNQTLTPLSDTSMTLVISGEHLSLVNIDTAEIVSAQAVSSFGNNFVVASHGQPDQPTTYVLDYRDSLIGEWDLCSMTKLRDISTPNCSGTRIAINDDHTCIARCGSSDEPICVIIDRRTMLPVHHTTTDHDYVADMKWHGHNIMISTGNNIELYDIRRLGAPSSSSSSSIIWSMSRAAGMEEWNNIEFSNDFQIALLQCRSGTSVYDLSSNKVAEPLYLLETRKDYGRGLQMTYDRLLSHSDCDTVWDFTSTVT
jgi:hypothetical protein